MIDHVAVEKFKQELSLFKTVNNWLEWRKQQRQKQWEEESLKAYEDLGSGHGDNDVQQGPPV